MLTRVVASFRKVWPYEWIMAGLGAALIAHGLFFAELVQAGGGLGWDGLTYARLVQSLPELIATDTLPAYYGGRILPAVIVRGSLLTMGLDLSPLNIVATFRLLNAFTIAAGLWFWLSIARSIGFGKFGTWLGFLAIFAAFPVAKLAFFNPVLVDMPALTAGLAMLYYYVQRNRALLALATLVAAFIWTAASVTGALLLLFLARGREAEDRNLSVLRWPLLLGLIGSLGAWLLLKADCSIINALARQIRTLPLNTAQRLFSEENACSTAGSFATGIAWAALIFCALCSLLLRAKPDALKQAVRPAALISALVVLAVPALLVRTYANAGITAGAAPFDFLIWSSFPPDGKFLIPLVSLFVFYGPAVLLVVLFWKRIVEEAHRLGLGVVLTIVVALMLTFVAEPRYLLLHWPFIVVCIAAAVDRLSLPRGFWIVWGGLAAAFSKVWLTINYETWRGPDLAGLQDSPKQLYFMHFGFWMGWPAYLAQGTLFAGLAAIILIWTRQSVSSTSDAQSAEEAGGRHL